MLQMVVAEKLGYTLQELMERVTIEELQLWSAYLELKHDKEQEAIKRASRRR